MKSPGFISTILSSNWSLAAPFQHQHPLVLILVVPKPFRGGVAVRDDPFDVDVGSFEQVRDKLVGQMLGKVSEEAGKAHDLALSQSRESCHSSKPALRSRR